MSLVGRSLQLAAKYGARWVVRAGVGAAARRAAARAAARSAAASGNRFVGAGVSRVQKGVFGAGVGSIAAGGVYAFGQSRKRPASGGYQPPGKRIRPDPKTKVTMNNNPAMVYRKRKLGRKIPESRKLQKIQRAALESQTLAFRGIFTMDGTTGANRGWFPLHFGTAAGSGIANTLFPVHCYNITATPNEVQNVDANGVIPASSNIFGPTVPWVLASDAAGTIRWAEGYSGATKTVGIVTRNWSLEDQTNTQDTGVGLAYRAPGKMSFLDWVNAKMIIYGKKKDQAKVTVSLVTFPEEFKAPEYPSLYGTLLTQHAEKFNDAAESFVRPLVNNPIVTRVRKGGPANRLFNVLYSKTFNIAPKMTDDENDDPNKVMFNLFKRMNRVINHRDPQSSTQSDLRDTLNQIKDENWIAPPTTNFRCQPSKLTQNVYLMIYGWEPRTVNLADVNSDYTVTYDLNLRKKQSYDE